MILNIFRFLIFLKERSLHQNHIRTLCGENKSEASEMLKADFDAYIYGKELIRRLLTGRKLVLRWVGLELPPVDNLLIVLETHGTWDLYGRMATSLASIHYQLDDDKVMTTSDWCTFLQEGFEKGRFKKVLIIATSCGSGQTFNFDEVDRSLFASKRVGVLTSTEDKASCPSANSFLRAIQDSLLKLPKNSRLEDLCALLQKRGKDGLHESAIWDLSGLDLPEAKPSWWGENFELSNFGLLSNVS